MLEGRKFILGVCGSIAAYKSAYLVRLLVKGGASVKVIMTKKATGFITPLTMATLSKNPVCAEFIKNESGEWNNHVELGQWADAVIIAPASANTIASMSNGNCNNLLIATYLSASCPVFIAPAMDLDMFKHGSTKENLNRLKGFGNQIIEPEYGELASGLIGTGRMAEPENITRRLIDFFKNKDRLSGKKILITAGPTQESIDPVRFIGNHSTGKMGYALAEKAAGMGAQVYLISGPSSIDISHPKINLIKVQSSDEMCDQSKKYFLEADIAILAAAVADYKPKLTLEQKLKKQANGMTMELVRTPDIAAILAKTKRQDQFTVGFALETENEESNAKEKLKNKKFDLIVLNSLNDKGAGFGGDTNKITILDQDNNIEKFELKSKREVADDIINAILSKIEI